jgi:hypothetical protein
MLADRQLRLAIAEEATRKSGRFHRAAAPDSPFMGTLRMCAFACVCDDLKLLGDQRLIEKVRVRATKQPDKDSLAEAPTPKYRSVFG